MNTSRLVKGVSIGIPVYNEELFIEDAIRSAAPQCEMLFISDNASSDRSADIADQIEKEYGNIIVLKHKQNIGALQNFKFLLDQVTTPYFMWLGAHDLIPEGYVYTLSNILKMDPEAILSFGDSQRMDRDGRFTDLYQYDLFSKWLENSDPTIRFLAAIKHIRDCSLIHGVFRTDLLRESWVNEKCAGVDLALLAKVALIGKMHYCSDTALLRRYPHVNDTNEKHIYRITGNPRSTDITYVKLANLRYSMAKEYAHSMKRYSSLFKLKTRFWLACRHGIFSENLSPCSIEKLAHMLAQTYRYLRDTLRLEMKWFFKSFRDS